MLGEPEELEDRYASADCQASDRSGALSAGAAARHDGAERLGEDI